MANLRRETSSSGVLNRLYKWLAVSDGCHACDVIFVLAGRECRKHLAIQLFRDGLAPALVMSVGRFEIRRFSELDLPVSLNLRAIASTTEPRRRHYFVRIESGTAEVQRIAVTRFGTLREIHAFSAWLRQNPCIRSAMVVSSDFHLKRVRMCCRRLVPEGTRLYFVAAHEQSPHLGGAWWRDRTTRRLLLSEMVKLAIYKLLLAATSQYSTFRSTGEAGTREIGTEESI